jgi:ATP/maltotriose-dependent transcriptional regulator MalT
VTRQRRTAARALTLAEPGSQLRGAAHFAFGGSALGLGRPTEAVRHLALAGDSGSSYSLSVGTGPDVHGRAWIAHAHWLLGDPDRALTCCTEAIALARTTGSPLTLAVALGTGAITHQLRGDLPALGDTVGELAELCDRYSFAYYGEWAPVLAGWLRRDGSGVPLARRGIDRLTADGFHFRMPYRLSLLADLLARDGRPDEARATLDAAIAASRAHDDVWWLPEVLRLRAAYDQNEGRAVARLHEAARLAASHGSAALLARCTAALRAHGAASPAFAVPLPREGDAQETNAAGTTPS